MVKKFRSPTMSKSKKPDQAVALALLKAGHSAAKAMKIAGYRFATNNGATSKASKLLKAAAALNAPSPSSHPAVAALDPTRRAIFDRLAPQVQAWLLNDPDPEQLSCELSDPNNVAELLNMRLTGDLAPGGLWDKVAHGSIAGPSFEALPLPSPRPAPLPPDQYLAAGGSGAPGKYQEYSESVNPTIPEYTPVPIEDASGLSGEHLAGLAQNAGADEPVVNGEWSPSTGFVSDDQRRDMEFAIKHKDDWKGEL
jgi:hypothetical protein